MHENKNPKTRQAEKQNKRTDAAQVQTRETPVRRVLGAGEWLRAVTGFEAPFGHDGNPTVWG